jgi:hypothetical protein
MSGGLVVTAVVRHYWNICSIVDIRSGTAFVVHSGPGNDRGSVGDVWRDSTLPERSGRDHIWNISDIWSHIWNISDSWSNAALFILNDYERLVNSGTGNDRDSVGDFWRDNTPTGRSGSDMT